MLPGYGSSATDSSNQPETPPVTGPNQPAGWAKIKVVSGTGSGVVQSKFLCNIKPSYVPSSGGT